MKHDIPDKTIDRIMTEVFRDASVDDEVLDSIVDSPALWWSVQKQINRQRDSNRSPWPPVDVLRRWLLLGIPATAAVAVVITSLLLFWPSTSPENGQSFALNEVTPPRSESPRPIETPAENPEVNEIATNNGRQRKVTRNSRPVLNRTLKRKLNDPTTLAKTEPRSGTNEEVKSEFIALSYARDPESGQLVRVKVPSSMMVTLGLVSTVNKPMELIDAEIVVGDDGMTRAIRFIR